MRHFLLLTSAPGALAGSVFQRSVVALLVAPRGAAPGFAPTNLCAAFSAVTITTVAGPTDAYLPGTTLTAIQAIALFACPHKPRTWHWTTPRIAGIKAMQTCLQSACLQKARGSFQECARAFVYPASGRENSADELSACAAPYAHHVSRTFTIDSL